MKQINERIAWLENAIKVLRKTKFRESEKEVNRIISICDYEDELISLRKIQKDNRSLF